MPLTAQLDPALAGYLDDFDAAGPGGDALATHRREAIDRARGQALPTMRDEDWRFTNPAPITATRFRPAAEGDPADLRALGAALFDAPGWPRLLLVNGRYCADRSSAGELPAGVMARPLAEALGRVPKTVTDHLGRHAPLDGNVFTALNTAFAHDGVVVHVPAGVTVKTPIDVLHVWTAAASPSVVHPRLLVIAERGSAVTVIERYVGLGAGDRFTNAVTEIVADDGTDVNHYKVVHERPDTRHVGTTWMQQGRDSTARSHTVTYGGLLVRNNLTTVLAGQGGHGAFDGLYVLDGEQHVDNFLRVDHLVPNCDSREFFKGILDDRARAVFTGRIFVAEDAQKTDAKQTNMNLLLSPDAQVDTKPQLEIFADDVKCTHGATIGQIDDEQIFYLRARGIDEDAARGILLYAFAAESLERVRPEPLRRHLLDELFRRLPQGDALREAL